MTNDLKTPEEWKVARLSDPRDAWKHAVASIAHGWAAQTHHGGEPMKLSAAEYDEALTAAVGGKLHEPAVSQYLVRTAVSKEASK